MRTTLLAPELFSQGGGIARILRLYLKAACESSNRGDTVGFLSLNDQEVDSTELSRYSDEHLTRWRACSRNKLQFIKAALALSRSTDRILCGHIALLPLAWAARKLNPRLRYYLIAHGIEVWRPYTLLERAALKGAEAIWCVSDYTRRQMLGNLDLAPERLTVLPNALDPRLAPPLPPSEPGPEPVVLAVTRLSAAEGYKGIDHLIAAMPQVLKEIPSARLRIVGRGDQLPELQNLAKRLELGRSVVFLGYVADNELSKEFEGCRLFAMPSAKEGFGLVYLEALAHGRPCLAARAGGAPEILTPETGVLVDYGDVDLIARSIVTALRRRWPVGPLVERSDLFSYLRFKERLASLIAP